MTEIFDAIDEALTEIYSYNDDGSVSWDDLGSELMTINSGSYACFGGKKFSVEYSVTEILGALDLWFKLAEGGE